MTMDKLVRFMNVICEGCEWDHYGNEFFKLIMLSLFLHINLVTIIRTT